ncbi:MAG TPA: VOC family protein [Verrucomicrobiae bacterium]
MKTKPTKIKATAASGQKLTPCLWYDDNAEEAVAFYRSIFKKSKVLNVSHYTEAGHGKPGSVLTIKFRLEGQDFIALNGGPHFKFTPAISFSIDCGTQAEVDYYWDKLLVGGQAQQCGWLSDKFGLCWQVVPRQLSKLILSKDKEKANRVMSAMLKMVKLDIATLEAAAKAKKTVKK